MRETSMGISALDYYVPDEAIPVRDYFSRPEAWTTEELRAIWTDTEVELDVFLRYFSSQMDDARGNFRLPPAAQADRFARDTGIAHIHRATQENASDMAVAVGRRLLGRPRDQVGRIDMLICHHQTINQAAAWGIACRVQHELALGKIPVFTISQKAGNCGFVAFKTAYEALIAEPELDTVLVIGCEKLVPPYRRCFGGITAMGDSATAIALRRDGVRRTPLGFRLRDYPDWWNPFHYDEEQMQSLLGFLADEAMVMMEELLSTLDLRWDQVAGVLPSNVSQLFIDALSARLPDTRLYSRNIRRFGYLLSSDLAINLATVVDDGFAREGEIVIVLMVGLGLSLGCTALVL